ncbi:MAG: KilA-N domain-containing protein [Flavobacteriales bacterium]
MKKNTALIVQGFKIKTFKSNFGDYISLTDIARNKNASEPKDVVKNWMRSKSTIEFLGLWEQINNPSFKGVEFDSFKNDAASNSFTLSPSKWIENTNAIGIISKQGRYDGYFTNEIIGREYHYKEIR